MGSSGKLGRQLKWASDQGARWALIYGRQEEEAGVVTVRDMDSGAQAAVPVSELPGLPGRAGCGTRERLNQLRSPSQFRAKRLARAGPPRNEPRAP